MSIVANVGTEKPFKASIASSIPSKALFTSDFLMSYFLNFLRILAKDNTSSIFDVACANIPWSACRFMIFPIALNMFPAYSLMLSVASNISSRFLSTLSPFIFISPIRFRDSQIFSSSPTAPANVAVMAHNPAPAIIPISSPSNAKAITAVPTPVVANAPTPAQKAMKAVITPNIVANLAITFPKSSGTLSSICFMTSANATSSKAPIAMIPNVMSCPAMFSPFPPSLDRPITIALNPAIVPANKANFGMTSPILLGILSFNCLIASAYNMICPATKAIFN